jgi:hypothetical protein
MIMLHKYQFEHRYFHTFHIIERLKFTRKMYKSIKFTVATGR